MALITCAECAGKVSTKAATCPHCGSPIENATQSSPPTLQKEPRALHDPPREGMTGKPIPQHVLTIIAQQFAKGVPPETNIQQLVAAGFDYTASCDAVRSQMAAPRREVVPLRKGRSPAQWIIGGIGAIFCIGMILRGVFGWIATNERISRARTSSNNSYVLPVFEPNDDGNFELKSQRSGKE